MSEDISYPILLCVSNGSQIFKNWVECEKRSAIKTDVKLVQYDRGHYINHFKSDEICTQIK